MPSSKLLTSPRLLGALFGAALLLPAAMASAQSSPYQFSDMCAPKTTFDTSLAIPYVHFVLDKSGSMGGSKWSTAVSVLKEISDAVYRSGTCNPPTNKAGCDDIFLGLSWFSSGSGLVINPGDDTRATIKNWLNNNGPNGGTNMNHATNQIKNNTVFQDTTKVRIGALITDGGPNPASSAADARNNLCAARNNGITSYVIGFGSGTNQAMNAYLAAAGGTGQCCTGSSCTFQPNELVDPCALSTSDMLDGSYQLKSSYKCIGAVQANTGQDLKNTLLAIVNAAACTFPLDIPSGYPAGTGADIDPLATHVAINHATFGPGIEVPFADPANPNAFRDYLVNVRGISSTLANNYIGEGFIWANATRSAVRLTTGLCNEIAAGNVAITETQVACLCSNTGDSCDVECSGGYNDGASCEGGSKVGRCSQGIVVCNYGVEECQQLYRRMPETCNGQDDNCDGVTDNMESGDPDSASAVIPWSAATQPVPNGKEGMFCAFQPSSCSCSGVMPDDFGMPPAQNQPEWGLYVDSYTGNCLCREGLTPAELPQAPEAPEASAAADSAHDPQAASCAAVAPGQGPAHAAPLLLLLGAGLGISRRRRRHLQRRA